MQLNYTFRKTTRIKKHLKRLEILKEVIELLPQSSYVEENLRRRSLLKSAVFSARIEGNKFRPEDILFVPQKTKSLAKLEIFNILKALNWVYSSQAPKKLTKKAIFKLHQMAMSDISAKAGRFRTEHWVVFNQAGIAVWVAPPPARIDTLMARLIKKTNFSPKSGPTRAALAHFAFEKIHPFPDGNGRVGRLLSTLILKNNGFGFRGLVSLEEYFDENRQTYYDLLLISKKNITSFVEFFLAALVIQVEKAFEEIKDIKTEKPEDTLLPRRREILAIIRDHKIVSFDFLRRRFQKVSASTLHYDLRQLRKQGFIQKIGTTRGARYTEKS